MTDTIKVNFGHLQNAADRLLGSVNKIEEILNGLEADLAPAVGSWDGEARNFYWEAKKQWDTAMDSLQEKIGGAGKAVNAANERFQAGERANAARFGG